VAGVGDFLKQHGGMLKLEDDLGVGILPYKMKKGDSYAYANPGQGSIRLSNLFTRRMLNMEKRAQSGRLINRNQALAAWATAHELGHMNSPQHRSEFAANQWAEQHFRYVLFRLGLNKAQRNRVAWLAQQQALPVD
jgi:hypothetical protein